MGVGVPPALGVGEAHGPDLDAGVDLFHGPGKGQEVLGVLPGRGIADLGLVIDFVAHLPITHPEGLPPSPGRPLPGPVADGLPVVAFFVSAQGPRYY